MDKLGFFTSVNLEGGAGCLSTLYQASENYFNLGSHQAFPINGKVVEGSQEVEVLYCPENSFKKWALKTALKVLSYATVVFPVLMLCIKLIFRITHQFHVITTEELMQKGIEINASTLEKVQSCVDRVILKKDIEGVHYYESQDNHRVFTIEGIPDLVFKMKANLDVPSIGNDDDTMEGRFQSLVYARTICRTHKLGLLVVPNAKLFQVEKGGVKHTVLAERKFDIIADETGQEELFARCGKNLDAAVRQLARFIAYTGYSDVEWRNNPVINGSQDKEGNYKIALLDVEELNDVKNGIFGGPNRRGLINCVSPEQGEIVIEEAQKHFAFWGRHYEYLGREALERRRDELAEDEKIHAFHVEHGVVRGDEPIRLGWLGPDFSGYPESGRLKRLAKVIVEKINAKIASRSETMSCKGRRYVRLDTNEPDSPFFQMDKLLPNPSMRGAENTFLGIAIKRLIELGCLYKITKRNARGYYLQA